MTVFYFTGTGNSLFVARKIAESFNAALISIPQAIAERKAYADDCIGFVYPQYADGLPKMVRRFILNNSFKADYIFAVDLYAFIHIFAIREIAGIIPLNYGAYLKTPNNFTFLMKTSSRPDEALKKAERNITAIIDDIRKRKNKFIKPRKNIGNATKYFGDAKFKVTAACNKCGTCVKVCPAGNIKLDGAVAFGKECENCYGCANLCPSHAIYANAAMLKRRQYNNPVISIDEIIKSNKKN